MYKIKGVQSIPKSLGQRPFLNNQNSLQQKFQRSSRFASLTLLPLSTPRLLAPRIAPRSKQVLRHIKMSKKDAHIKGRRPRLLEPLRSVAIVPITASMSSCECQSNLTKNRRVWTRSQTAKLFFSGRIWLDLSWKRFVALDLAQHQWWSVTLGRTWHQWRCCVAMVYKYYRYINSF